MKGKSGNDGENYEKEYTAEEWAAWDEKEQVDDANGSESAQPSSAVAVCPADEWIWEVECWAEPPQVKNPLEDTLEDVSDDLVEEGVEEEQGEEDPVSEMTETATPGSAWEFEAPRPKLNYEGDKPRKPRASNRANQIAAAASEKALDEAWGSDAINTLKWGPVTKVGKATFMTAFGQEVDFHTFNLKELIAYAKKVDFTHLDMPSYVASTLGYIWELWSTWNTDSEEDVAFWLMETCLPQISSCYSFSFFSQTLNYI